MVRFEKLASTEKTYPFIDAIIADEYANGTFGTIADGIFTAGAAGFYVIMNAEDGNDAKSDDYRIDKGAHARIADLALVDGHIIDITSAQLPSGVKKGDKMVSKADGSLNVPTDVPTTEYIEVMEVTSFGVRAKVVK